MKPQTAAACLSLLVSLSFLVPACAQDELRWKFKSGETLKYAVQQQMQTEMLFGGKKLNQTMRQTMGMSWDVSTVAANGDALVAQTVDRVQMKLEGGPLGNVQFDTDSSEEPTSPVVKSIAEVFRKIVGQQFRVTMKPTGKVQNVEVPESLKQQIESGSGASPSPLNEDTLKQMMEQSSVVLPDGPVSAGQMWESIQEVKLPFGTMRVTSSMTYEGRDAATGLAKISMKPTISVIPGEGAQAQIGLKSSEGLGQVLFDTARGRIVRSTLDLTLQMQVTQLGQTIDQTVHQKTIMALEK